MYFLNALDRVSTVVGGARRAAVRRAAHDPPRGRARRTSAASGSTTRKPRLHQRYQLEYHALSERYIVHNVNSGDQTSFATLFAALDWLGRVESPAADRCGVDRAERELLHAPARGPRRRAVPRAVAAARVLASRLVARRAIGTDGHCKATEERASRAARGIRDTAVVRRAAAVHASHRKLRRLRAALQNWIVPINSIGIAVLLVLIVVNLCAADPRLSAPRAGLASARANGAVLVMVAITPLVGVYIFSVEFINRGIDNWFNVDIEKGLEDVLQLGQTALDIQTRGKLDEVQRLANRSPTSSGAISCRRSNDAARESAALELTVYGPNRRSSATTRDRSRQAAAPQYPSDEVLLQLRQAQTVRRASSPRPDGGYQIIAAAPLATPAARRARVRAGDVSDRAAARHARERGARQLQPVHGAARICARR